MGGYGLYYRSVMAEMELIYPGGWGFPYPVDVPSEMGKRVAAAFRQAVKDTTYYRDYFDSDAAKIPTGVVQEYIHRACLCQLQRPDAPDHDLLLDVFLHYGHAVESRRQTFRLFLDIADQTQGYALDQDRFRQLLYFRAENSGATYAPQDSVMDSYRRWRLFQAREYYAFALNALWYYFCDWGLAQNGDVRPIAFDLFWQHLTTALDFKGLADWFEVPRPGLTAQSDFHQLLTWLTNMAGTDQTNFDTACILEQSIHEHWIYWKAYDNHKSPELMVTGMITMLALIYLRFGQPDLWLQPEWAVSRMGTEGRLSVDGFLRGLRRRLKNGNPSIIDIARWLYTDYIVLQHQLIANSKLPDNTFRFQREGNQLRFFSLQNSLEFMDSRFDALSTTIHELGLCGDLSQPDHPLTETGQQLLTTGDVA